ncbi:class I SAM-dependent methyltransferase [Flavobacterium agricola]|uniref:Class I SAM-dependent methyltransferase n=1 Tax=Flavobacterium agricola TaxID=2870839 RepID=A0ABY6M016_9FLAO|nr:class I SAM-dependent methyltransferase [Flavobacterium agricola]UYW01622.1 class I SAM-dependent methyltransferase [Flavobacterium agricola]
MDKKLLRESIFRHLDGIVVTPVVKSLQQHDVLKYILEKKETNLNELTNHFKANDGYLNVALRVLAAQGFLNYEVNNKTDEVLVVANQATSFLYEHAQIYTDLFAFTANPLLLNNKQIPDELCKQWVKLFEKYHSLIFQKVDLSTESGQLTHQIQKHIEGALLGPIIVRLGMNGMFHNYFMQSSFSADEFHKNPECFEQVLQFLTQLGWFTVNDGNFEFTETGLFFARRATAYGVTVSYLPMFSRVDDLIFGDPKKLRDIAEGQDEIHVDREMNVWGSGGAHTTYFKVIDHLIIEIFNRPIEEQPKGILDMGCGNGALLQHLYEVIERFTLRGKMLEQYPLFLVGADYNQAALKVTRANLIKNDIWAKVIWGDIGNPDLLAKDLQEKYKIELSDLLNMRTFLDHNRIWEPTVTSANRLSTSTGAFAFRGERLSNNAVEENLKNHLQKWSPYLQKFGLLLIELHTIAPNLTAQNIGKTPATAYDATHGFSDQYILEIDVFHKVCKEAGLNPVMNMFKRFPDSDLATVSINLLKQ